MIDTTTALQAFLEDLPACTRTPPSLYIDLEGNNLSAQGTLSLMTILVEPQHIVHLIDVTTLGKEAFDVFDSRQRSLRLILESVDVTKVFFDIRNDSNALYGLYGIRVNGIEDLQLMELASRQSNRRVINGLAKCIEKDAPLSWSDKRKWSEVKQKGRRYFAPELGGSFPVFDKRPLASDIEEYCKQDVTHMPALYKHYRPKLCDAWWRKIEQEVQARIALSQTSTYNGQGRHMALAPSGWTSWSPSSAERYAFSLLATPTAPVSGIEETDAAAVSPPAPQNEAVGTRVHNLAYHALNSVPSASPTVSYEGSDDDSRYEELGAQWRGGYPSSDEEENDFGKDLTACDEECGYCGRCPY